MSLEEVFVNFHDPLRTLRDRYGVQIVEDAWFDTADNDESIERFAVALRDKSRPFKGYKKRITQARHDAKALIWIERQRKHKSKGVWFVTTDRRLPQAVPKESEAISLAISASALFQWISPILGQPAVDRNFLKAFAHMVRERILPTDRFLDLADFLVFDDMNVAINELPHDQVLQTLREIKTHVPHLNPSNPKDQQVISRIVARHLVDPGSRQATALSELEKTRAEDRARYAQDIDSRDEELQKERERRKQLETQLLSTQNQTSTDIQTLRDEIDTLRTNSRRDNLIASARYRLLCTGILALVAFSVVLFLSNRYAGGANLFQKVLNSWALFLALVPGIGLIGWFIIGKEGLKAIGGPIARLFGETPGDSQS
jgi:hypothetical protein